MIKEHKDFYQYVLSFYGAQGVYPMNAAFSHVRTATLAVIRKHGEDSFCGDSIDRERVRDVLIDRFGYVWPN